MESTSILLLSFNWLYSNCIILTTTLVVYVLVKQLWWEYNLRKKLPPGPLGVPFLGYLPFMTSKPYLKLTQLAKTYGGVFGYDFVRILSNSARYLINNFYYPIT